MTVTIATIKSAQIKAFHSTFDSVAREGRYLLLTSAPALSATERFVGKMLEDGNPFVVAADRDGTIAGWCSIYPESHDIHAHVGLLGIALLPQYRGIGIGTKLMSAALDRASARGFQRIELTVYANNNRATRLYEKFDFVQEGIKRASVLIGDAYVDVIMMAKLQGRLQILLRDDAA